VPCLPRTSTVGILLVGFGYILMQIAASSERKAHVIIELSRLCHR
jgi:hypothetical protein